MQTTGEVRGKGTRLDTRVKGTYVDESRRDDHTGSKVLCEIKDHHRHPQIANSPGHDRKESAEHGCDEDDEDTRDPKTQSSIVRRTIAARIRVGGVG